MVTGALKKEGGESCSRVLCKRCSLSYLGERKGRGSQADGLGNGGGSKNEGARGRRDISGGQPNQLC